MSKSKRLKPRPLTMVAAKRAVHVKWSAHMALEACERRLLDSETARTAAEGEVTRLRGLIDTHEKEAEIRHTLRASERIHEAQAQAREAQDQSRLLRRQIQEFFESFDGLRKA